MAQYAVPDGDISDGGWEGFFGETDLFAQVNAGILSASPNDSNGIKFVGGGSQTCQMTLEALTDPSVNTNHIIRVRANHTILFGSATLTASIYQGATTLVDSNAFTIDNANGITNYSYTLDSNAVAASLSDYTTLRVRLNTSDGDIEVYEVEFEVPDVGGGGGGEGPKLNPEAFFMFL